MAVVAGFGEVGEGLLPIAARSRLSRHRIGDRSDLCAFKLPWKDTKSSRSKTSSKSLMFRHRNRQQGCDHRRSHAEDEGQAIIGNIGHFDNEIDMAGLQKARKGGKVERRNVKPQYDHGTSRYQAKCPDSGRRPIAQPRLRNGPPKLRDELQLHQSSVAQLELWTERKSGKYEKKYTFCQSTWTKRLQGCTWTNSVSS